MFGGYFKSAPRAESGHGTAVRAESGLPITHGACLRLVAEMSDPPVLRIGIDTGQSGHPSDPHYLDQYDDWSKGTPRQLPTVRADIEAAAVARIALVPQ